MVLTGIPYLTLVAQHWHLALVKKLVAEPAAKLGSKQKIDYILHSQNIARKRPWKTMFVHK